MSIECQINFPTRIFRVKTIFRQPGAGRARTAPRSWFPRGNNRAARNGRATNQFRSALDPQPGQLVAAGHANETELAARGERQKQLPAESGLAPASAASVYVLFPFEALRRGRRNSFRACHWLCRCFGEQTLNQHVSAQTLVEP